MLLLSPLVPDECVIDRVIVHILDNRNSQLLLQAAERPLDAKLTGFVRRHVTKSIGKGVRGIFDDRQNNGAWAQMAPVFDDMAANFVPSSQELARQLFSKMGRKTIKAGALWFVAFSHRGTGARGLGILKMDDSPAVVYNTDAAGQLTDLEVREHALPGEKDLDKAAFIVPENDCLPECHLRMMDRRRAEDEVAKFFMEFLGCQPPVDATTYTRRFMTAADEWLKNNRPAVEQEGLAGHYRETKRAYIATRSEIDVEDFAGAVMGDRLPDLRADLADTLTARIGDQRFEVDSRVQTRYRQRKLDLVRGGQKVTISGDWAAIESLVRTERHGDGTVRIVIDGVTVTESEP